MLPVYTLLQHVAERTETRPAILIGAVMCVAAASVLSIVVSLLLVRRMRAISERGSRRAPDDDRS